MTNNPPRLAVVGSINRDFIVRTHALPAEGETVIGLRFDTLHGGKGANQAAAAALVGHPNVEVFMVGAVGAGPYGREEVLGLETSYVHVEYVAELDSIPTGTAFVTVDRSGSNHIVVVPGANRHLVPGDVAQTLERIDPDVVLISLEINLDAVAIAAATGRRIGATVILNPAPCQPLPPEIYRSVDVMTPNWIEFLQLVGAPPNRQIDPASVPIMIREAEVLSAPPVLIVTLGDRGAAVARDGAVEVYPAKPAMAVDTTGAGDAFNGALASALASGLSLGDAVRVGMTVGAVVVGIRGARVPHDSESLSGILTAGT